MVEGSKNEKKGRQKTREKNFFLKYQTTHKNLLR